ncbi:MAG: glutamine amidotransferase [Hyphomicrobiales bacterium]|nr:glutamine amidotransferase [Hyphomicrobiales bacterium]
MKTCLAIRHVHFEDLGLFEAELRDRGWRVDYCEPGAPLPPAAEPDLLAILGGPLGAYEDDAYPFLPGEVAYARARLDAGRPLLGVCLGAQIMARALGARVYPGPVKEIGWAPITLTDAGRDSPLAALGEDDAVVLHWHGDTFDLPEGARLLASTAAVPHQAFDWGDGDGARRALAVQFHPEVPAAHMERWLVGHAHEIATTPGIDPQGLRAATARHAAGTAARCRRFFAAWLDAVA